jgi:hypothetical protein
MIKMVINLNEKSKKLFIVCDNFYHSPIMNVEIKTRAESRYDSGSTIMMRLLVAAAPQHCGSVPEQVHNQRNIPSYTIQAA